MITNDNPMGFTQEQLDKMEESRKRYDELGKDIIRLMIFDGEMTDEQYEEIKRYAKHLKTRDSHATPKA